MAIDNMIKQLNAMRPIFDFTITISGPTINDGAFTVYPNSTIRKEEMATVWMTVATVATDRSRSFFHTLENTLLSLGQNQQDISALIQTGYKMYEYNIKGTKLFFYNEMPLGLFGLLKNVKYDFSVTDNNNSEYIFIYCDPYHYHITVKKEITWDDKMLPWENSPFVVPIEDMSTISNFIITPSVEERTCFLFVTKMSYPASSYLNVTDVKIEYLGHCNEEYWTAYRKKDAPHCDSERILNNPNKALVTADFEPSCLGKTMGYFLFRCK